MGYRDRVGSGVIGLTHRQKQVMELVVTGKTYKQIGAILGIAPRTVMGHVAGACNSIGAGNRTEAVVMYVQNSQ